MESVKKLHTSLKLSFLFNIYFSYPSLISSTASTMRSSSPIKSHLSCGLFWPSGIAFWIFPGCCCCPQGLPRNPHWPARVSGTQARHQNSCFPSQTWLLTLIGARVSPQPTTCLSMVLVTVTCPIIINIIPWKWKYYHCSHLNLTWFSQREKKTSQW